MPKGGNKIMDFFKKLTLASIGAVTLTREKLEETLDELVKKGEMTTDEKAEAVKHFVDKSIDSTEKAVKKTEEMVTNFTGKFSTKFNEQVTQLSNRIEQINVRLSELEKKFDKPERA
jgi:polyhydroxyalkanoate synthesis regulator phasin